MDKEKWDKTRQMGKWPYIIILGGFGMGVCLCFLFGLLMALFEFLLVHFESEKQGDPYKTLGFFTSLLPLAFLYGLRFGDHTWNLCEEKFTADFRIDVLEERRRKTIWLVVLGVGTIVNFIFLMLYYLHVQSAAFKYD